jgi:hypothetical protein
VSVNGHPLDELPRDARSLSTHNPLLIEVRSKIIPGRICQFIQNDQIFLRFPYTQRSGETLRVPPGFLNELAPRSTQARPPSEFEPTLALQEVSSTSFSIRLDELGDIGTTESPRWRILGADTPNTSHYPMCEEQSFLSSCGTYSITGLERIFQLTARTAAATFREIVRARRYKTISLTGRNRKPIELVKAAPRLAQVRSILRSIPRLGFECPTTPTRCGTFTFPKKELLETMEKLFRGPWPKQVRRAVARVQQLAPGSRQRLQNLLNEYPNSMTVCQL